MKTRKLSVLFNVAFGSCFLLLSHPLLADDHGNTAGEATWISPGNTGGEIDSVVDEDWFAFQPQQTGLATVAVLPASAVDAAPRLLVELKDEALRRLDIDSTPGASIKRILTAGATYYVRIRSSNSAPNTGGYRVRLSLQEAATPFVSDIVNGSLEVSNDVDLYSFDLSAPGLVNITTRPPSSSGAPLRLSLALYNSAGSRLDLGSGTDAEIRRVLNQAGRYYVRVVPLSTAPNTGGYALQLRCAKTSNLVTSLYQGNFPVPQDRDYIRFRVSRGQRIVITSSGAPSIMARLYDAAGNFIALSSSGKTSIKIDRTLKVGTYYLLVQPGATSVKTGNYQIRITR